MNINNRYIVVYNGERHASYSFLLGESIAYKYALLTAKWLGGEIIEQHDNNFTKIYPKTRK